MSHPPDQSLFSGIRQLPPGSYLMTDAEDVRVVPYWDWDYPIVAREDADPTPGEWVQRIRQVFEEAVRLRLRADVPWRLT